MHTYRTNLGLDLTDRSHIPNNEKGKQAVIIKKHPFLNVLRDVYGRSEAVLKLFHVPMKTDNIGDYYWGSAWRGLSLERTVEIGKTSKLWEATVIQNLLWLGGLAARVYALITVETDGKVYPAQLVEYLDEADEVVDPKERWETVDKYLQRFGCLVWHKEQAGIRDYRQGKVIDVQGARFTDRTKDAIRNFATSGAYGSGIYQSIEELGIGAHPRNTKQRIQEMGLDTVSFGGKNVLDVGCNVGTFCNYASDRGARRVIGIDLEKQVKAAQVLSTYLGYFNVDYHIIDLKKFDDVFTSPDITFFLSMNVHVGFPEWIARTTSELLIFEENAKGGNYKTDYWIKELSKYFSRIEHVGYTTDHNPKKPKPVLYCYK